MVAAESFRSGGLTLLPPIQAGFKQASRHCTARQAAEPESHDSGAWRDSCTKDVLTKVDEHGHDEDVPRTPTNNHAAEDVRTAVFMVTATVVSSGAGGGGCNNVAGHSTSSSLPE